MIRKCTERMLPRFSQQLVIFDLGAGLSAKTIALFEALVQGNPDIQICYIPVDLSDVVHQWQSYIDKEYPHLKKNLVHILPVVKDLLEAVKTLGELNND